MGPFHAIPDLTVAQMLKKYAVSYVFLNFQNILSSMLKYIPAKLQNHIDCSLKQGCTHWHLQPLL